jgi:hypothetical protein
MWLIPDAVRRLLREPMVLRSLTFPGALSAAVVAGTVFIIVGLRPPGVLALSTSAAVPGLVEAATAAGWPVEIVDDPRAAVADGHAMAGSDGSTVWTWKASTEAMRMDSLVRTWHGGAWRPEMPGDGVLVHRGRRGARHMLQLMGSLFAFYGVVFGAGSVARDRDQGTLEAELTLPVAMWVHGASRWAAASIVLTAWWGLTVALFHALLGAFDPWGLVVHGASACVASVAIGLAVIGRAGIERGFAGPLSAGLVAVVSLLSYGLSAHDIDRYVPIASLMSTGDPGWSSLGVALAASAASVGLFTWRATTI